MSLFSSPLEAFLHWEKVIPDQTFLIQPINGKTKTYSYKDTGFEIRKIASKLKKMGLDKGSHVAILSKNCAHWMMADLAIMMAELISIPIYTSLTASAVEQVLNHSESKAIILGKLDDYNSIKKGIPNIPKIGVEIYGIEEEYSWEKIIFSSTNKSRVFR